MNLRTKISLTVSLLVAAVVAGLGMFTHIYYEKQFKMLVANDQNTMVGVLAGEIESKLWTAQQQLIAASRMVTPDMLDDVNAAQRFLDNRPALLEIFDNHIGLFTMKGIEVTESPAIPERRGKDFSQRSYIKDTIEKKGPVITEPYLSSQAHNHPAIAMSAPVYDKKGVMTGILLGSIDLTRRNILGRISEIKVGRTGYMYLTTADRAVVIHPHQERIFKKITPKMNPLYDRVIEEGFEGTDNTVNYTGTEMLTTFKRLKINRWILAANYPVAEAFAPVHAAVGYFMAGSVAGTLVIFALTWLLMKRITAHLGYFARHVSTLPDKQGDDRMLNISSGDEIGILSQAFNGMIRDLDENQQKLRESLQKYRALLDTTDTGFVILDDSGCVLDANSEYVRMTGHSSMEQILGRPVTEWTADYEKEKNAAAVSACIEKGSIRGLEIDYADGKGHITPIEINATVVKSQMGHQIYSLCRDVTARRQTEREQESDRRMLQTIIDTEPECVKILDSAGNLVMMNRAGLSMIQADSLDMVKGRCVYPLVSPEYREAFRELTERIFRGETGALEFEMTGLRGRSLWLETHAVPMLDDKGNILSLLGVTRDITERRHAEQALRESERRFRETLENANLVALQLDEEGTITFANKYFAVLTGWDLQEILGSNWIDMFIPADMGDKIRTMHAEIVFGGHIVPNFENEILTKDGRRLLIAWTNSYLLGAGGQVIGVTSLGLDITEHRRLEEQLRQTQKLESIGTLAGGIAHDFNNLLQGIFGYISMARMSINDHTKALAMIEQAEKALHLSVNLTSQLLTFSKGGKPVIRQVELPQVIENAVRFALSGARSTYILDMEDGLWPVLADEGQLSQVIQNITLNADQAMPLGGTIRLSVKNAVAPGGGIPSVLKDGRYVSISVIDQGIGIQDEYLPKIFDPYFTTKEKGSGLGLATSYAIIRNHGGVIVVSSVSGKGTTFTIYLPAGEQPTGIKDQYAHAASAGPIRILLMDDEDMIRNLAAEMISSLGHEVMAAENGEAALAIYKTSVESGRPFDLVILDLTIRGGMGGAETLKLLKELDPSVKAIVSSGYSDDASMSDYLAQGFRAALKKPYTIETLKTVLAEAMC